MSNWTPMVKIPRYYRDIVITEKIDGTNGAIYVPPDHEHEPLQAYSKNRPLFPEPKAQDNHGFAGWVAANAATLAADLGPGVHRGEWWGVQINRGYDIYERRFSLFNVAKWSHQDRSPFQTPGLTVVPILYEGPHTSDAIEGALAALDTFGSSAAGGFAKPEGVVVFHKASGHMYKVTCENDAEWKGKRQLVDANGGCH